MKTKINEVVYDTENSDNLFDNSGWAQKGDPYCFYYCFYRTDTGDFFMAATVGIFSKEYAIFQEVIGKNNEMIIPISREDCYKRLIEFQENDYVERFDELIEKYFSDLAADSNNPEESGIIDTNNIKTTKPDSYKDDEPGIQMVLDF